MASFDLPQRRASMAKASDTVPVGNQPALLDVVGNDNVPLHGIDGAPFTFWEYPSDKLYTTKAFELEHPEISWRQQDKTSTPVAGIIVCLNIGVDPPDCIKPSPCARAEGGVDPFSVKPEEAIKLISTQIKEQYKQWLSRAEFKMRLDPTMDQIRDVCLKLRALAKSNRVLLHWNGHGAPRPTAVGETWVFNKNFTQYVPVSIFDLQQWVASPAIFVFDCNGAGNLVNAFNEYATKQQKETNLVLAACGANESLPTNPALPADLFTSCLTTPIATAVMWSHRMSPLCKNLESLEIPGSLTERATPLGTLNWIFTAITDAIAWDALPRPLFRTLFRQDRFVASMFRNFLLACRIMRKLNCAPMSHPTLPRTDQHPLWLAWDRSAEHVLLQLPRLAADPNAELEASVFFVEQMCAFEVWLNFGNETCGPPVQLPILLQTILTKTYRLRTLELLAAFLDKGVWAVEQILQSGFLPYILKLTAWASLDEPMIRLLVIIVMRVLVSDSSTCSEFIRAGGAEFIKRALNSCHGDKSTLALAAACGSILGGTGADVGASLIPALAASVDVAAPLHRRWHCLALGKLWSRSERVQTIASEQTGYLEALCGYLTDPSPPVRAASTFALGLFLSGPAIRLLCDGGTKASPQRQRRSSGRRNSGDSRGNVESDDHGSESGEMVDVDTGCGRVHSDSLVFAQVRVLIRLCAVAADPHLGTRRELIVALVHAARRFEPFIIEQAMDIMLEHQTPRPPKLSGLSENGVLMNPCELEQMANDACAGVLGVLAQLTADGNHSVQSSASSVLEHLQQLAQSGQRKPSGDGGSSTNSPVPSPVSAGYGSTGTGGATGSGSYGAGDATTAPSLPTDSLPVSSLWERETTSLRAPVLATNVGACWKRHHPDANERQVARALAEAGVLSMRVAMGDDNHPVKKVDREIIVLDNESSSITHTCFHRYESVMAVGDSSSRVTLWDFSQGKRLCQFTNGGDKGTAPAMLSSLTMVNDAYGLTSTRLLCGSHDGVVRVYHQLDNHADDSQPCEATQLSSFVACPELTPLAAGSGASMLLCNGPGSPLQPMIVSCSSQGMIRVYDLEREQCSLEWSGLTVACVSAGRSQDHPSLLVTGHTNGSIAAYDLRVPESKRQIFELAGHKTSVVRAVIPQIAPGSTSADLLVSGAAGGEIYIWDLRTLESISKVDPHPTSKGLLKGKDSLTNMDVHSISGCFTTSGSKSHKIKVFDLHGGYINSIRSDNFLGRAGPVTCLAFHPLQTVLAAGFTTSVVSVYGESTKKTSEK